MNRNLSTSAVAVGLLALTACGPLEIKVSKEQGLKPMNGTLIAKIDTQGFKCGDSIIATGTTQTFTVTSQVVGGGCEFNFDQEVEVLADADYATIKEFKDAARYVSRVEIKVSKFVVEDENGNKLDFDTRVRELELKVNDQVVLDLEAARNIPKTVVLQGPALDVMKTAIKNRATCKAHVVARVVINDITGTKEVHCTYETQPTLILSTVSI